MKILVNYSPNSRQKHNLCDCTASDYQIQVYTVFVCIYDDFILASFNTNRTVIDLIESDIENTILKKVKILLIIVNL